MLNLYPQVEILFEEFFSINMPSFSLYPLSLNHKIAWVIPLPLTRFNAEL